MKLCTYTFLLSILSFQIRVVHIVVNKYLCKLNYFIIFSLNNKPTKKTNKSTQINQQIHLISFLLVKGVLIYHINPMGGGNFYGMLNLI